MYDCPICMASRRLFSSTRLTRGVKDRCPDTSGVLVDGHHLADGLHDAVVLHVEAISMGGQAVLLLYEAEQDVLGAHVGLMERAGLVLRQDEHLARFVRKLLE